MQPQMGDWLSDSWKNLVTDPLQKEIDKLPGEAEKRAQEELMKLAQPYLPAQPAAAKPQPAFISNLSSKFKVQPMIIYAGLAAAAVVVFMLVSGKRSSK